MALDPLLEELSGGDVFDPQGRRVMRIGGGSGLSPGEYQSGGKVVDADGREVIAAVGAGSGGTGPTGPTGPAGLTWQGTWSAASAYVVNDAVYYLGSSYRRLIAGTTAGTPAADTTNWTLLALAGTAGATGTPGTNGTNGADGATGPTGPAGPGVPVGGTTGQLLAKTSATDFATAWVPVATKTFRSGHSWAVGGALTAALNVPSIFVPKAAAQTPTLVSVRAKIGGGTSIVVQLTRNGTNLGSTMTVTTTAASFSFSQALADLDELDIVLSSPTGSPVDLSLTLIVEHVV